jgi:hypothetical protein
MGFNKRYIDKESIILARNQGLKYLINYIKKPDSLIIQDNFSQKICDIILNEDEKNLASKLMFAGLYD